MGAACRGTRGAGPTRPASGSQSDASQEQPMGSERCPAWPASSRVKSMPAAKPPSPSGLLLGHIQATPQLRALPTTLSPSGTPHWALLPRQALGWAQGITGWSHATAKGVPLAPGPPEGLSPSPAGPRTAPAATPAPQNKMTNEQKQTKTDESHPGWRRRAEAPWRGRGGAHLMNASGLGRCEWKAGGPKEEMAGACKETREEEKEQSCSLGQIFCCFIRFSVHQLVFAKTGIGREC